MERAHTEMYTRKRVHTERAHKYKRRRVHTEKYTRRRAQIKECTHGKSTHGRGIRGEEHIRSIHTQKYIQKRAHTKDCTHGVSTRRGTHGESAHGGVHTVGAHMGRAHMEEYTRSSTNGGEHISYLLSSVWLFHMCVLSFISPSSIELQWAKFSDGIFYAIVSV